MEYTDNTHIICIRNFSYYLTRVYSVQEFIKKRAIKCNVAHTTGDFIFFLRNKLLQYRIINTNHRAR